MADKPAPGGPEESIQELIKRFGNLNAVKGLIDVEKAVDRDPDKDAAIVKAQHEYINVELSRLKLENESIKQSHEDQKANREMRFKYSKWVFSYLVWYSIAVLWVLMLSGDARSGFTLDPEVLKYLVGSTAAAAIGLVAAVTTGLFNNKK